MLWKNAAKKEYMDLIEPQQKRLENAIDDILGERNPDELQRVYELGRAAATRNLDALKAYFEV